MLLFRPPLMRFGRPGVVPANFAADGDEPSPLDNDLPSLTDRASAEWLWVLLSPLPSSGTTEVNDSGGYALIEPDDGTYTQDYRGLAMPLTGTPEVYEDTITTTVGETVPGDPPVVTVNPSNASVLEGANASFTASATGATSRQWEAYISGAWSNVSSATGDTLNLTAVALALSGRQYRCRYTNADGTTYTTAATLTVTALPVGTAGPMSVAAYFQMMLRAS